MHLINECTDLFKTLTSPASLPPPPFSLTVSLGRRAQGDRNKPNGTTEALLEGVEAAGHGVGVAQAGGGWVGGWRAGTGGPGRGGKTAEEPPPKVPSPCRQWCPEEESGEGLGQTRRYRQQVGPQGGQTDGWKDGQEAAERAVMSMQSCWSQGQWPRQGERSSAGGEGGCLGGVHCQILIPEPDIRETIC